jgi:hypothetical protein
MTAADRFGEHLPQRRKGRKDFSVSSLLNLLCVLCVFAADDIIQSICQHD